MIRKIKILIATATAALSLAGCLDKLPDNAILADRAMTTVDDADQIVIGIYAAFKSSALYSGYLALCPDIQSDLVYAVDGYTNTYGNIWRWEILATNSEVEAVYASLYSVIGNCNFFFDNVEKVRARLTDDSQLERLEALEGEVYFARALAYSELIKMYCKAYEPATAEQELGVALITSYHNPERMIRSNLKKSYEFVLDDLTNALDRLPISLGDTGSSYYYFTKDAANALFARVYLYMQDWDKAIEHSTAVIENDNIILASATTLYSSSLTEYQYMWRYDHSKEIIWQVGFTTTSRGGALGQVFLNYDNISYKPDYVPASWALDLYSKSTDRRYNTFFASATTGHTHGLTWPILIKYHGNDSFFALNIRHVVMPKVFRLSEQYLIRAEAYCRKENYIMASRDITTLRLARYTSYGSASLTVDNWLKTIGEERIRELFMEGHRLHDLKRWHQGFERTPQPNSVRAGSSLKIKAGDPLFVWPIPQHELDSPGSEIQPNDSNY